jgi:N-glycosylase/DNA lyase
LVFFVEMAWYEAKISGHNPKSTPLRVPITRSDRVVALLYPRTLVGRPGPILGESMPNPSLMRGQALHQFLTMRYNTGHVDVSAVSKLE